MDINRGYGAKAAIITAATTSLDPVNFTGIISRKKGRVIIVRAVPTGFSREIIIRKNLLKKYHSLMDLVAMMIIMKIKDMIILWAMFDSQKIAFSL